MIKKFLDPEGHQNAIGGSKVLAILLKGWILTFGGASWGERSAPAACAAGLFLFIWVEPARKGKGQKIGNFTLYVLGSLDHLYIFCFTGNCHVFEAYTGESYYGI